MSLYLLFINNILEVDTSYTSEKKAFAESNDDSKIGQTNLTPNVEDVKDEIEGE